MEILNEVYFGRKPVAPLQKQITVIRKKLAGKSVTSKTNLDPEIIKFNRLVEKIFGFKSFCLYIQPNHIPNAYAFPVDTFFTDKEKQLIYNSLSTSPEGFKYTEAFTQVSLVVAIHSGLFDNRLYTDEEIMATLLHEIGHGFFSAVTNSDCRYCTSRKFTELLSKIFDFVKDKIKGGKAFTIDASKAEVFSLGHLSSSIRHLINKTKPKFLDESMDDNMRGNMIHYTNEKFADTFAALYGYGKECHSMEVKLYSDITRFYGKRRQVPQIIETLQMFGMLVNDMVQVVLDIKDEHPATLARVQTTIDYLKKELGKDSIDPKMKRELVNELSKSEKLLKDYIDFPKDEDSMRVLRVYYTFLWKNFGGDLRERKADNDALFQTTDDRYEFLRKARYHANTLK